MLKAAHAVLAALLAARADLGVLRRADVASQLTAKDPAARAAAVHALARTGDPAAFDEIARLATADPDPGVRTAAIDGLGESKRPEAMPILTRTFDAPDKTTMQHSARAMLAIGGDAADEALVNLALRGRTPESRRFAAYALVMTYGRNAPIVHRMEASNPPPEVRDLLEHGLKVVD